MRNIARHTASGSLRRLATLILLAALVASANTHAAANLPGTAPAMRFLSVQDGRSALAGGPGKAYFDNLQMRELRAKTGLPLEAVSLPEARELARKHYASQVLEFSDVERAALAGIVQRTFPVLREKAALYTRTTWSFIKVGNEVEGGLPHTRGDHIVLSSAMLDPIVGFHKLGRYQELDAVASNLLVHELTHVLQRQKPALFAALNTEVLGFRRLDPAPVTTWLLERGVVNPDAPDCGWAFPVEEGGATRWIMPYLVLRSTEKPRMPRDFVTVGVTVERASNGIWRVVELGGQPKTTPLESIEGYRRAFPGLSQAYHPNEISAEILAGWITGHEFADPEHPLNAKVAKWAADNLK